MAGSIDIIGPAAIAGLNGTTLSSLGVLPPDEFSISDSNGAAAITVRLTATAPIALSASSIGGASIASSGDTLTISGTETQVNTALASLDLTSAAGLSGLLSLTASDSQGATASTTLGLTGYADPPPAFVAPPASFSLQQGVLAPLSGLTLAAEGDVALGLIDAGPEAMAITLIASNGALALDPALAPGLAIGGNATGTLVLGFTSAELAAANAALAAVGLLGNGNGTLAYIARALSGPLDPSVTSGSFTYGVSGAVNPGAESWNGGDGLWQAGMNWSGGYGADGNTAVTIGGNETIGGVGAALAISLQASASLSFSADVAVAGSIVATGAIFDLMGVSLAPAALSAQTATFGASGLLIEDAAFSVQNVFTAGSQSSIFVGASGTLDAGSYLLNASDSLVDFGSLAGGALNLGAGAEAFLPGGGVLGQIVSLGASAVIDFAGLLQGGATAATANPLGVTLADGATIEGAGTLVSGDFSESGVIEGPGTILAAGPTPLTIAAGSIGGGAQLVIDPGAVLELGAVSPLYGVFNPTPLTIDSSANIVFAPGANATQDASLYPSGRGEQGGVLLLDYPGQFAGTITGFAPGDRIAVPQLANLSLSNLTGHSFTVSGTDANGATESDIIHANYASGLSPFVETDIYGDSFIGLRATTAQLTLDDVPADQAMIDAVTGYQEPITGLGIMLPTAASAALALTISAVNGLLTESSGVSASTITLTGSNGLDLNHELAALFYTPQGGGSGDTLRFTGSGGGLNGFSAAVAVSIAAPATLAYLGGAAGNFAVGSSWSGGNAPANGDILAFGSHAGAADIVSGSGEAAGITVTGAYDFAGTLTSSGQRGTALTVDGNGMALFDANAVVSLPGLMMIGDQNGAGTVGVAGSLNAGLINLAGNTAAGGSILDISGSLTGSGLLAIGGYAAGTLDLTGHLTVAQTTIGSAGLLRATGSAAASLGAVAVTGGTFGLSNGVTVSTGSMAMSAGLILLGDKAALTSGSIDLSGGILDVGAEAQAGAQIITIGAGATMNDSGSISATGLALAGAVTLTNSARLTASGAISLSSAASLSLAGGVLGTSGLTIASGATLSGFGEIGGTSLGALPSITVAGELIASNGRLTLGGDATGNLTIAPGASLDLAHGATQGVISFTGANETLIINDVGAMQDIVSGMVASDAIELVGIAPASVGIANGTVSIADPSSFGFTPAAGQPAPQITGNNSGGSTITMGSEMPCFARGTLLLTPSGYRPVEALAPGDSLITETGLARGIVWIGSRVIDLATDPAATILRPVVIQPGAFGKGFPLRRLRLSPLHGVYVNGVLIPSVLLVNGATITRDDRAQAVTYYHVEMARHDVVKAEGLAVETYRDTGNRHRFAEAQGVPGCLVPAVAPLVTHGTALARVREALHQRAFALDYQLNHAPDVRVLVNDLTIHSKQSGKTINLIVPERGAALQILSRSSAPAETDPYSEDRRNLGICIGGIRAGGRQVLSERLETDGWHRRAGHDCGHWTTGNAILKLPPDARRVSLELVGSIPAWLVPAYPTPGPII